MLGIVGDPDLEKALALMADGSSTVDKVFLREGDFGDMEVRGDGVAIGKVDGDGEVRMVGELGLEFGKSHEVTLSST